MKIKPTWFSDTNYIADKLVQLKALGYEGATIESVTEAITGAGGAWNHYELWGYKESYLGNNVTTYLDLKDASGNVVFNTQLYCESKLASLQLSPEYAAVYKTWQNVADMFAAMNLSPYDHFVMNGAAEGLTISSTFNANNYFVAKLQSLIKADPQTYSSWSTAQLAKYFADNNVDPYQNFVTNGAAEGITPAMVAPTGGQGGQTYDLTIGLDNLVGTSGNDMFVAYDFDDQNTLQSGDRIDGGAGRDTLEADLVVDGSNSSSNTVTPITNNVEVVKFNARDTATTTGSNYTNARVDAERMHGVEEFWSTKSRGNVSVEDVVSDSNTVTSVFQSSDPGNVDFKVTFNSQNLRPIEGTTTGKLSLELIDGQGAAASPSTPLLDNAYDTIIFHYNNKPYEVKFDVVKGATATYDQLMAAIQKGIDANAELKAGGVTAAITGDFVFFNRTGQQVTGKTITLSSATGPLEALTGDGWKASGTLPPANNLSADMKGASSTTCPLIQTNIGLDNVGSIQWDDTDEGCLPDNAIFGSRSGDMVVGGAGARDGVERFDIKADRGSWLNSLSSTNNTLRMINLTSGDWNGDGIAGISAAKGGQVFIGSHLKEEIAGSANQFAWQDRGRVLGFGVDAAPGGAAAVPAGIWDVKNFDASTYTGDVNIAAQFTAASYDKYLKDVDGLKTVYSNFAPDGEFKYGFGTGNDTLNMKIHGGIAADKDFKMIVEMGDGNDYVNFQFGETVTNWVIDQTGSFTSAANNNGTYAGGRDNISIDTGLGDDTVYTWVSQTSGLTFGNDQNNAVFDGAYGAVNIKTGDGKNLVYAAQSTTAKTNAVWVLNANSSANGDRTISFGADGAQPHNNSVASTVTKWTTTTAVFDATKEYNVKVLVDFMGVKVEAALTGKYKTAGTGVTNLDVTAEDMNNAVIKAINDDPVLSKLLIAKDGAGNSLLVESLIDGHYNLTDSDFNISFFSKATTDAAYGNALTFAQTGGGSATGYLQQAYDANVTAGDANGLDQHYYGFTNITGGTGDDILVTGYADAYVKSGAGKDTIIVGNETYNKITAGADADAIHLGSTTTHASNGNNGLVAQAGAYDAVHQLKGDSGTFTASTVITTNATTSAISVTTGTYDAIFNFDHTVTNTVNSDRLYVDSYAAHATTPGTFAAGQTGSTFAALKTYIANTDNGFGTVRGTYNSVTGTFTQDAAAGTDLFVIYDADASTVKQYEGVVLVGLGDQTLTAANANATEIGYLHF